MFIFCNQMVKALEVDVIEVLKKIIVLCRTKKCEIIVAMKIQALEEGESKDKSLEEANLYVIAIQIQTIL